MTDQITGDYEVDRLFEPPRDSRDFGGGAISEQHEGAQREQNLIESMRHHWREGKLFPEFHHAVRADVPDATFTEFNNAASAVWAEFSNADEVFLPVIAQSSNCASTKKFKQHEAADNHLVVRLSRLLLAEEYTCRVCGQQSGKTVVVAEAVDAGHTSVLVCRGCLKSGDIDGRLERHAQIMDESARYLRSLNRRLVAPADSEWQEIVDQNDNDARDEYERVTGMNFPGGRAGEEIPF